MSKIEGGSSGVGGEVERRIVPFTEGLDSSGKIIKGELPHTIEKIRGIQREDLLHILRWSSDPETRAHLDPAPDLPQDWNNPDDLKGAIQKLEAYYRNEENESRNVTPLVAVNQLGNPVGVLTIRWRGDPYVPRDRRIASIERVIVDPQARDKHIGTELVVEALEIAFNKFKGYGGNGAKEVRLWTMTDRQAGDYNKNINFFRRFGFQVLAGNWREFAAKRGIKTDRDAMWYSLKQEVWEEVKERNRGMTHPEIVLPDGKLDLLSIRL